MWFNDLAQVAPHSLPLSLFLSPSVALCLPLSHSLALLLLPCQATQRCHRRRAMWSCLNLILCALHTPLPQAVTALPPCLHHYLSACLPLPMSASLTLPLSYQFYWLRPIYIFKLFREMFRELCQVYEKEREIENFTCVTLWWNLCMSLSPPPLSRYHTVWECVPNLFVVWPAQH